MEAADAGGAGKIAALAATVKTYRAELSFDFRHEFGMPLSDIGEGIPWPEAIDLIDELGNHPGSHYWSAINGMASPTTYGEIASILHATRMINLYRPDGAEPVQLPGPFPDRGAQEADVTPEERDELVEYARATAPFSLDD